MAKQPIKPSPPVIFITGAARRLGRAIAEQLHDQGAHLTLHYHRSKTEVTQLAEQLNLKRPGSVYTFQGNLNALNASEWLNTILSHHNGRLTGLIHNASSFFPTPIGNTSHEQWHDLMNTNLYAPFFLSQAAAPTLKENGGSILFMLDIFAERPMLHHPVYSAAKAGAYGLMRALARELAPHIRVNAVAPGGPIKCEDTPAISSEQRVRIPLQRQGTPKEIADAVTWLTLSAPFTTGQVIYLDGGQHLVMQRAIE